MVRALRLDVVSSRRRASEGPEVPGHPAARQGSESDADPPEVRRVAAAVLLRDGRVLVQTRVAPGRWAGYWEFPGGGLEPGEDEPSCVRRECLEELGLAVRVLRLESRVSWSYDGRSVEVGFFRCELDGAGEPAPREGQRLAWADADTLGRLRFLPANAELVRRLASELSD
ncbi:MAG: hypothetical protein DRQ55_04675 [Planctomycetota bacterium]|nr:MAG: hypothetical protein DRQ55_04675 [Planctomycetota bacterium]